MKPEPPLDLPAGAFLTIPCELRTGTAGPFEAQMHIYVEDQGLREFVVLVKGLAK